MRIWTAEGEKAESLAEALALVIHKKGSPDDCCVISAVGGGGKTSLLYCLACECGAKGLRVIVTTTTKMAIPDYFPYTQTVEEAEKMLKDGPVLVGRMLTNDQTEATACISCERKHRSVDINEGLDNKKTNADTNADIHQDSVHPETTVLKKCIGLPVQDWQHLRHLADVILVEADGAKHKPLKAAAAHEPVIPEDSNYVIGVAGVDAVGKPLSDVCHRAEIAAESLSTSDPVVAAEPLSLSDPEVAAEPLFLSDPVVTEETVAALLSDIKIGQKKGANPSTYRVLLNKADSAEAQRTAFSIAKRLEEQGITTAVAALRDRVAMIVLAAGRSERFGANKLTAAVDGEPMYRHLLRTSRELLDDAGQPLVSERILVTRQGQEEMAEEAEAYGFRVVMNPEPERGISSSIRLGVEAIQDAEACLFVVCDQPHLSPATIRRIIDTYQYSGKTIAAVYPSETGNPTATPPDNHRGGSPNIFSMLYKNELLSLTGDTGGRRIIRAHPTAVTWIPAPPKELRDIDYPEDL